MSSPMEKYLAYASELHWKARQLICQADPNTANGSGLDDMAAAIGISPRQKKGDFTEVDQELRNRILEALGIQTW